MNAAAVLLPDVDELWVRRLGIDEHRYRRVRWFRDEAGGWRRVEPWMSTIVNADSGQVLGVVDGRDSAAVGGWLAARSPAWRARIEVVAIDPSAAFRRAIREQLPDALVSVDPFHLVQLANLMVTRVRQRLVREREHRRGRKIDPAWAHRTLLLRGYDTLSERGRAQLQTVFDLDDPTDELSAAWGVKEQLRRLLKTSTVEQARHEKMIFDSLRAGRRHGRDLAAVGHHRRLVAGHRGADRHRRHQRPHRGREHRHQADQTDRPRLSQSTRTTKPVSCSAAPPDARREHLDQAGHHGQLRIATNLILACCRSDRCSTPCRSSPRTW